MKTAQKWNFYDRKYAPCNIPDEASTFEADMDKKVACAQCGKLLPFGDCYTSRQIHTKHGMGYAVCEDCYEREGKDERNARIEG